MAMACEQAEFCQAGLDSPIALDSNNAKRFWLDPSPNRIDTSARTSRRTETSPMHGTDSSPMDVYRAVSEQPGLSKAHACVVDSPQASARHQPRPRASACDQSSSADSSNYALLRQKQPRSDERVSRKRSSERKCSEHSMAHDFGQQHGCSMQHADAEALDEWAMNQLSAHGAKERRTMVAPLAQDLSATRRLGLAQDSSAAYHGSTTAAGVPPHRRVPFSHMAVSRIQCSEQGLKS